MSIVRVIDGRTHLHTELVREIASAGFRLNGLFLTLIDNTLRLLASAGSMMAELMRQALVSDGGYKAG